MSSFVLATHNQHKVDEFTAILTHFLPQLSIVPYDGPEPIEDGASFTENALIKARAACLNTGLAAIADDSGLCVDILGGSPGIFSSRWSGKPGHDSANVELLLAQIKDVPEQNRTAHFTCVIAMVTPEGNELVVEGVWPGRIARKPSGVNGFGYDPIFIPEGYEITAAEMQAELKNQLSHRSRALEAFAHRLGT